ncbi:unnamed protein product, partial [Thlaspi arvense]
VLENLNAKRRLSGPQLIEERNNVGSRNCGGARPPSNRVSPSSAEENKASEIGSLECLVGFGTHLYPPTRFSHALTYASASNVWVSCVAIAAIAVPIIDPGKVTVTAKAVVLREVRPIRTGQVYATQWVPKARIRITFDGEYLLLVKNATLHPSPPVTFLLSMSTPIACGRSTDSISVINALVPQPTATRRFSSVRKYGLPLLVTFKSGSFLTAISRAIQRSHRNFDLNQSVWQPVWKRDVHHFHVEPREERSISVGSGGAVTHNLSFPPIPKGNGIEIPPQVLLQEVEEVLFGGVAADEPYMSRVRTDAIIQRKLKYPGSMYRKVPATNVMNGSSPTQLKPLSCLAASSLSCVDTFERTLEQISIGNILVNQDWNFCLQATSQEFHNVPVCDFIDELFHLVFINKFGSFDRNDSSIYQHSLVHGSLTSLPKNSLSVAFFNSFELNILDISTFPFMVVRPKIPTTETSAPRPIRTPTPTLSKATFLFLSCSLVDAKCYFQLTLKHRGFFRLGYLGLAAICSKPVHTIKLKKKKQSLTYAAMWKVWVPCVAIVAIAVPITHASEVLILATAFIKGGVGTVTGNSAPFSSCDIRVLYIDTYNLRTLQRYPRLAAFVTITVRLDSQPKISDSISVSNALVPQPIATSRFSSVRKYGLPLPVTFKSGDDFSGP